MKLFLKLSKFSVINNLNMQFKISSLMWTLDAEQNAALLLVAPSTIWCWKQLHFLLCSQRSLDGATVQQRLQQRGNYHHTSTTTNTAANVQLSRKAETNLPCGNVGGGGWLRTLQRPGTPSTWELPLFAPCKWGGESKHITYLPKISKWVSVDFKKLIFSFSMCIYQNHRCCWSTGTSTNFKPRV